MNPLPDFRLSRPSTYAEAAALLAGEPSARLLAGGTDLVPNMRRGLDSPTLLVDLGAVQGRQQIDFDDGELRLGAGVTLAQLAADPRCSGRWAAIGEAARAAAGPGHRTVATLGGNLCLDTRCVFYNQSEWWRRSNGWCLKRGGDTCHVAPQGHRCHAAFSGDLAPALIALGAQAEWLSARGTRLESLEAAYRDDGAAHLTAARDEVLVRVRIPTVMPSPPSTNLSGYRKARVRGAMDFPLAGVAAALTLDGGVVSELRVALTGTNSQPLLLQGCQALIGRPLDDEGLATVGKLVGKQVSPMRSTVTPSNYRRQVAVVLAQRLLHELAGRP